MRDLFLWFLATYGCCGSFHLCFLGPRFGRVGSALEDGVPHIEDRCVAQGCHSMK